MEIIVFPGSVQEIVKELKNLFDRQKGKKDKDGKMKKIHYLSLTLFFVRRLSLSGKHTDTACLIKFLFVFLFCSSQLTSLSFNNILNDFLPQAFPHLLFSMLILIRKFFYLLTIKKV